jgi:hypothetical protein
VTLTVEQIIEAWKIIEALRAPEAAEVTLICDNPDFNGQPNSAIEVCDDWTGWETKRFTGDTVLDALRAAYLASRQPSEKPQMSAAQFEDNLKRST